MTAVAGSSPAPATIVRAGSDPLPVTIAKKVAFEAVNSRPTTVSSPSRRSRRAVDLSSRPATCRPSIAAASISARVNLATVDSPISPAIGSVHEPIAAGADVALRIERLATERARRPSRGNDPQGLLGEGQSLAGRQVDPHDIGRVAVLLRVVDGRLITGRSRLIVLGHGPGFDDDRLVVPIPDDRHRADPEYLVQGLIQGSGVDVPGSRFLRNARAARTNFNQQLVETVCQQLHLDLLYQDGHDPAAFARLQEEGPIAGLADSAGNEPVGVLEFVDASNHLASGRIVRAGTRSPKTNLYLVTRMDRRLPPDGVAGWSARPGLSGDLTRQHGQIHWPVVYRMVGGP